LSFQRKKGPLNLFQAGYQIYRERFAEASAFTFTFTGSIDTNTMKPMLEKYLGSLPIPSKHEQDKDLNIYPPDGKIARTVYKGTEPKAAVILDFQGKFIYSPANKIKLDALKECLEIRLLHQSRLIPCYPSNSTPT
jgi:zinc protease